MFKETINKFLKLQHLQQIEQYSQVEILYFLLNIQK